MKRQIFPFVIFCASLLFQNLVFYSCKENHIHGPGEQTVEIRMLEHFNTIVLYDNIELHMRFNNSGPPRAEITGGENLIQFVTTEVKNNILTISNENKWNWIRNVENSKIYITIYTDSICHLIYNGVEPLVFDNTLHVRGFLLESKDGMGSISLNLKTDSTTVILHTGAPDVFLFGESVNTHLYSNSHGQMNALGLLSDHVTVHSRATCEISVSPEKTLGVTIEYLGNVYYKNFPTLLWVVESNMGRLIKLD
jgi:hypothetical protein